MRKRNSSTGRGKALDLWQAPMGAGEPLLCVATTFTFDATFFETECLGRFLQMDNHPQESDAVGYLIEREEKMAGARVAVLVDRRHAREKESWRWDILPVVVPNAVQHAKLAILCWAEHVRVLIGSANLTEKAYRKNVEVMGSLELSHQDRGSREHILAAADFLDRLLEDTLGEETQPSPRQRVRQALNALRKHIRDWQSAKPSTTSPIPIFGGIDSSVFTQLAEWWPASGPPRCAHVLSPFFDRDNGGEETVAALLQLLAKRGTREVCFYVPWESLPDGRIQAFAPRALIDAARSTCGNVFVHKVKQLQESEPRDLHAKMLVLANDDWELWLLGSSNFTRAGFGIGSPVNRECNLAYRARVGALEYRLLNAMWSEIEDEDVDLDSNAVIWQPMWEEEGESHIHLYTKERVSKEDAERQENTAEEVLRRLEGQPGVVLADEVGMGKTFVALAVATSILLDRFGQGGPIVVMVPPTLREKWPADWDVFRQKCLDGNAGRHLRAAPADSGVAFLKLLDQKEERPHLIFLTHGALHRALTDGFVKLAVIRRAFKGRSSLGKQRRAFAKFAGRLLQMESKYERRAPGLLGQLLETPSEKWLPILRRSHPDFEDLSEAPVPVGLQTALERIDSALLQRLIETLRQLPLHKGKHIDERLKAARQALSYAMSEVWKQALKDANFLSPLLILDEAHHLKNPATRLASLFVDDEAAKDSDCFESAGALGGKFERMLFLTATPFQLGHVELIRVLERFEGIAWHSARAPKLERGSFKEKISELGEKLDDAQAAALRLDRIWGKLREDMLVSEDGRRIDVEMWWQQASQAPKDDLSKQVVEQVEATRAVMCSAEALLHPWVIRHRQSEFLPGNSEIPRRRVLPGAAIRDGGDGEMGPEISREVLLPFLLAGRARAIFAASTRGRALFAEGLASSFEAYLETRSGSFEMDEDSPVEDSPHATDELNWYHQQLDRVLPRDGPAARLAHPKVRATAERVVQLWGQGEKVLVFCHYRATGRALRQHIATLLQDEIIRLGSIHLAADEVAGEVERIGKRFSDRESPLHKQVTEALQRLVAPFGALTEDERNRIVEIIRRFLRTPSFLVRYLDLTRPDRAEAYIEASHRPDAGGMSLHHRIDIFCRFLTERCTPKEREKYLDALHSLKTGNQTGWDVAEDFDPSERVGDARRTRLLPNVRLANGEVRPETRRRLLLAFNTPLFPEILIASSVLTEGVDLHLNCRHVIHHDLCWNPSTLEQRTGRVDRLGSLAERVGQSILVYLPYVSATQDEKMYRVVCDRQRWFQIVLGEKYEADEIATDRRAERIPLPQCVQHDLVLRLER